MMQQQYDQQQQVQPDEQQQQQGTPAHWTDQTAGAAPKAADVPVTVDFTVSDTSSDLDAAAAKHKRPEKQTSAASIYDVRSNRRRNAILFVAALATMIVPCSDTIYLPALQALGQVRTSPHPQQ